MAMTIDGITYSLVRGSDGTRDGMFLELCTEAERELLEVFYADADGRMTLTAYRAMREIPLAVIEWTIHEAHRLLPPVRPEDAP